MSENGKILAAIAASAVVHVLFFFLMVLWVAYQDEIEMPVVEEPVELELVLEPELEELFLVAATPTPTPTRRVLDTTGLEESDTAPENALFESAVDSRAASDTDPTGAAPLPSQDGRDRPVPQFEYQRAMDGPVNDPPGMAALPAPRVPEPTPETPPPRPTPADARPTPPAVEPMATPEPVPEPTPEPVDRGVLSKPTPRAVEEVPPVSTPTPAPTPTPTPAIEDLAMMKPTPRKASVPSAPGYQAHSDTTRIEGSITNRGRRGVDAVGTPLGRYQKDLASAIGSRWNRYIMRNIDLISVGSVHVRFFISAAGRAQSITVVSSTSNSAFANFCVQSITEAEIPPIPPEVVPILDDNRLEIDYTFTIYPN